MTSRQRANRTVVVHHRSRGCAICLHCRHTTRFYRDVGWVDTTPPFYGGTYDMCPASVTGQHDPESFDVADGTMGPVDGAGSAAA
jgi:hypothetical protein